MRPRRTFLEALWDRMQDEAELERRKVVERMEPLAPSNEEGVMGPDDDYERPWRTCCHTRVATDHLADCRFAKRPAEPSHWDALTDQETYRASAEEARRDAEEDPLSAWADVRADDSKGVPYKLPWATRAYARLRWLAVKVFR